MDSKNRPTYIDSDDKDPMQRLQVIRIPPEFREKLAQMRRDREAGKRDDVGEGLAPLVGLSVIAVLYLVGLFAAYTTGLSEAVLISITPAARALITTIAIAGAAISVFWLVYAFVRSNAQPEDDYTQHDA